MVGVAYRGNIALEDINVDFEVEPVEPLECELLDFVSSVRDGVEPSVTGVAGRRALAVAEAITQAMKDANRLPGVGDNS